MSQGFESFKADGSVGFNSASRTLFFQSDTAFEAYGYYTATYPDSRVDTFLLG